MSLSQILIKYITARRGGLQLRGMGESEEEDRKLATAVKQCNYEAVGILLSDLPPEIRLDRVTPYVNELFKKGENKKVLDLLLQVFSKSERLSPVILHTFDQAIINMRKRSKYYEAAKATLNMMKAGIGIKAMVIMISTREILKDSQATVDDKMNIYMDLVREATERDLVKSNGYLIEAILTLKNPPKDLSPNVALNAINYGYELEKKLKGRLGEDFLTIGVLSLANNIDFTALEEPFSLIKKNNQGFIVAKLAGKSRSTNIAKYFQGKNQIKSPSTLDMIDLHQANGGK